MNCPSCYTDNIEQARFCTNCGASLQGLKGRLEGISRKIRHQTTKAVDEARVKMDNKISELLVRLDEDTTKIGSYEIPVDRKPAVKKALTRFQDTFGPESPQAAMTYDEWVTNLPSMLETEKCIVCFGKVNKSDAILVCPHCETGGHRDHIRGWYDQSKTCPFCRETVQVTELVQIET